MVSIDSIISQSDYTYDLPTPESPIRTTYVEMSWEYMWWGCHTLKR